MPNQVLTIEPQNELKFKGMFEQGCTTHLKLTNPTADSVLFKIKTTAPKKYCVRPNSGIIDPNSKVEIAITPQPVYVDQNEKHKHKFMVQSVIAPEGKAINIDQMWKEITPEQLMDYKLKCVFETPRGTNVNDSGDNAAPTEATKKRVAVKEEPISPPKEAVEEVIPIVAIKKEMEAVEEVIPIVAIKKEMEAVEEVIPIVAIKKEMEAVEEVIPIVAIKNEMTMNLSKSENVESDLQKALVEVILLREEESKLRHENLQMKEELLRLRQAGGETRMQRSHYYGPEKSAPPAMMPWVVAAAMALLGVIVGKFFM